MKKIFYLSLVVFGFISCSKSIYGKYQFKNDYTFHIIKLNKNLRFEYFIDDHLLGFDTITGVWNIYKDTILIINKDSDSKSKIIENSYNGNCIEVVDNWDNPLSEVLIKINDLDIYKTNENGKICDKNILNNISKIQIFYSYSSKESENLGIFYPKVKNSGFIIKIDFRSNDVFIKSTPNRFIIKGNKLIPIDKNYIYDKKFILNRCQ